MSFTYWNHLDHVVLIHSLIITMVFLMVSSHLAWPFYACIASSNMLRSNSCSPIQCGTFSSHAYITWDEKYSDRFPIKMIDQFQSLQIIPKMWKISRFVYTLKTGKSWITMLLVNFKVSLPSEIKKLTISSGLGDLVLPRANRTCRSAVGLNTWLDDFIYRCRISIACSISFAIGRNAFELNPVVSFPFILICWKSYSMW